jgi:hypothetical protein
LGWSSGSSGRNPSTTKKKKKHKQKTSSNVPLLSPLFNNNKKVLNSSHIGSWLSWESPRPSQWKLSSGQEVSIHKLSSPLQLDIMTTTMMFFFFFLTDIVNYYRGKQTDKKSPVSLSKIETMVSIIRISNNSGMLSVLFFSKLC